MDKGKNRWFVKREHYLNADEFNVCMKPEDEHEPVVCIGSCRGMDELKKFAKQMCEHLNGASVLTADVRKTYEQIVSAISEAEAAYG